MVSCGRDCVMGGRVTGFTARKLKLLVRGVGFADTQVDRGSSGVNMQKPEGSRPYEGRGLGNFGAEVKARAGDGDGSKVCGTTCCTSGRTKAVGAGDCAGVGAGVKISGTTWCLKGNE